MGSRGPTATPGSRRWQKNREKGIISLQPPASLIEVPDPPAHVSADVKALYRTTADTLIASGVQLLACDWPLLLGYAECVVNALAAEQHVSKHGLTRANSRGNLIPNPHLSIAIKARHQASELGKQLGISPAARSRMQIQLPEGDDEFSDFAIEAKLSRPRPRRMDAIERALCGNLPCRDTTEQN